MIRYFRRTKKYCLREDKIMKHIINTSFFKLFGIIYSTLLFSLIFSCKSTVEEKTFDQYKGFFKPDEDATEVFRVLILSDRYESSQMKFQDKLVKIDDKEGDKAISDRLREYDKIDETCDGVLTVSLYNTGKIMKIRPKILAPISEVNSLIVEDLKRWNFKFADSVKEPNSFDIKYRVVLRKIQSDEDIMKEVMEKAKKEEEKKGKSDD
jgi:hypothetical protein